MTVQSEKFAQDLDAHAVRGWTFRELVRRVLEVTFIDDIVPLEDTASSAEARGSGGEAPVSNLP